MADAIESAYIAQLNPMEQKILYIAQSHLETSFSLKKSIGFQEWQKVQELKQAEPIQELKQAEPIQEPKQAEPIQEPKDQTLDPKVQPKKQLIKRKIKIKSIPS